MGGGSRPVPLRTAYAAEQNEKGVENQIMKKKLLKLAVALALCLGLTVPTCATSRTFTDVPAGAWYSEWVEKAVAGGLISGYSDERFGPNDNVTYTQLVVMLLHALSPQESVQPSSPWWMAYVEAADSYGILDETNMEQRSDWANFAERPITREQMAQMVYNTMEAADPMAGKGLSLRTSAEEIPDYLSGESDFDPKTSHAVLVCHARKLLSGDANGYFHPKDPMTRAEAAVVICRVSANVGRPVSAPVADLADGPAERPAGAVGGQYDIARYDVPADTNKDGWITEAEVQVVLDQLKIEYPDGSPWDLNTRYPGRSDGKGMGAGTACGGFANMVSDRIFGTLPAYYVPLEKTRVGDIMIDGPANHANICLTNYGTLFKWDEYRPDAYETLDGNSSGKVSWGDDPRCSVWFYEDWPTRTPGTDIWSRYPKE